MYIYIYIFHLYIYIYVYIYYIGLKANHPRNSLPHEGICRKEIPGPQSDAGVVRCTVVVWRSAAVHDCSCARFGTLTDGGACHGWQACGYAASATIAAAALLNIIFLGVSSGRDGSEAGDSGRVARIARVGQQGGFNRVGSSTAQEQSR